MVRFEIDRRDAASLPRFEVFEKESYGFRKGWFALNSKLDVLKHFIRGVFYSQGMNNRDVILNCRITCRRANVDLDIQLGGLMLQPVTPF